MYLGSVATQAGSMAASTGSKFAAGYAATALGYGSMAGPIGTAVGAIVSIIMSLFTFGPKPKDPVYGLVALVPRKDGQKLKVHRLLSILGKNPVNMGACWGLTRTDPKCLAQFDTIKSIVLSDPQGALGFVSGGTPKAHEAVTSSDFNKIRQHTDTIAKPFVLALSQIVNPQIKDALSNFDLGFKIAYGDYYFLYAGSTNKKGESGCRHPNFAKSGWCTSGIGGNYDEIKINQTRSMSAAFDGGMKKLVNKLNEAFISTAGIDVVNGKVVNQALADQAFTAGPSSLPILASSNFMPLLLVGGVVYLLARS